VRVRPGHGVGIPLEMDFDKVVKYDGHRIAVRLAVSRKPL
jgi:hypothetical protein